MKDDKIIYNKNFFVFTGGPGVGKTTVLNELGNRNFRCVQESARQVIKEQTHIDPSDPVWRKSLEFAELSLNRSVESFKAENSKNNGITFFDRGIIDCISHPQLYISAARQLRYNNTVFIFPPWKEIYHTDDERIQSYEESVEVYYKVINIYKEYEYELLDVPKTDVSSRVDFIISNAEKLTQVERFEKPVRFL